jgi:hypothetical protein
MKKLLFLTALFLVFASVDAKAVNSDCTYKGKKLYGRIKIVTSFPDVKVKIVSSFPDVKVKQVQSFADRCGLWHVVDSFPDLKVQFVDSFPDITIKYVDSFPGL